MCIVICTLLLSRPARGAWIEIQTGACRSYADLVAPRKGRVQNSVFECLLDTAQCRKLQNELCKIIDPEKDSLRFYYLGKKYENKIEHFGCKQTYLPEEPMIL